MAEQFYIRVRDDQLEWLLLDDASGVVRLRGAGDFATFEDMIRDMSWDGRTRVFLPGEDVLLTEANVPSKQPRQILQAIPFMVEEDLATDVDQCHFAAGPRNEQGNVSVAVVSRKKILSLLEMLAEAGIKPEMVTPDVLHLPHDHETSVLVDGDRALVRTGDFSGFVLEQSLLPTAISLLDEAAGASVTVHVHPSQSHAFQMYLSQIEAESSGKISTHELDCSPFEYLCRSFDPTAINLLQGEFRVEEDNRASAGGWRSVAILAACAFGLEVMLLVGRGIYLDVQTSQYQREARAMYASVFPNDHNVRNLRLQWRAHISAGSGQPTGIFFDLFGKSAQRLAGSNLTLENINYSENRGDLIMQMTAPRYDAFDNYAQALRKDGLNVQIGTISQDGGSVRGSIRVKPIGDGG